MAIEAGDIVTLHFTLSLADGREVESSGDEPLTVVIGQGQLLSWLEQRLMGLNAGDHQRFEISAAETMAESAGSEVEVLARADFPADIAPEPGTVIGFELPDGEEVAGTVVWADEHEVHVDFAHPLAGRDLLFDVTVLSVLSGKVGHDRR